MVAPTYESRRFGSVPCLDAVATVDEAGPDGSGGELAVFAVNRSQTEGAQIELRLGGYEDLTFVEGLELAGFDPKAANTAEDPDAVLPRSSRAGARVEGGILRATLPALSWNVIRLAAPRA